MLQGRRAVAVRERGLGSKPASIGMWCMCSTPPAICTSSQLGGDALGRLVDRLQAGAADAVDRDAADLDRQAGDQGGHAGDVVALLALLLDAAPVDVLDLPTAGTPTRSSSAFIRSADRSSARTSRKMPFSAWARPMGVRTASMTTA